MEDMTPNLQVLGSWHKFHNNKWVLGVTIHNASSTLTMDNFKIAVMVAPRTFVTELRFVTKLYTRVQCVADPEVGPDPSRDAKRLRPTTEPVPANACLWPLQILTELPPNTEGYLLATLDIVTSRSSVDLSIEELITYSVKGETSGDHPAGVQVPCFNISVWPLAWKEEYDPFTPFYVKAEAVAKNARLDVINFSAVVDDLNCGRASDFPDATLPHSPVGLDKNTKPEEISAVVDDLNSGSDFPDATPPHSPVANNTKTEEMSAVVDGLNSGSDFRDTTPSHSPVPKCTKPDVVEISGVVNNLNSGNDFPDATPPHLPVAKYTKPEEISAVVDDLNSGSDFRDATPPQNSPVEKNTKPEVIKISAVVDNLNSVSDFPGATPPQNLPVVKNTNLEVIKISAVVIDGSNSGNNFTDATPPKNLPTGAQETLARADDGIQGNMHAQSRTHSDVLFITQPQHSNIISKTVSTAIKIEEIDSNLSRDNVGSSTFRDGRLRAKAEKKEPAKDDTADGSSDATPPENPPTKPGLNRLTRANEMKIAGSMDVNSQADSDDLLIKPTEPQHSNINSETEATTSKRKYEEIDSHSSSDTDVSFKYRGWHLKPIVKYTKPEDEKKDEEMDSDSSSDTDVSFKYRGWHLKPRVKKKTSEDEKKDKEIDSDSSNDSVLSFKYKSWHLKPRVKKTTSKDEKKDEEFDSDSSNDSHCYSNMPRRVGRVFNCPPIVGSNTMVGPYAQLKEFTYNILPILATSVAVGLKICVWPRRASDTLERKLINVLNFENISNLKMWHDMILLNRGSNVDDELAGTLLFVIGKTSYFPNNTVLTYDVMIYSKTSKVAFYLMKQMKKCFPFPDRLLYQPMSGVKSVPEGSTALLEEQKFVKDSMAMWVNDGMAIRSRNQYAEFRSSLSKLERQTDQSILPS